MKYCLGLICLLLNGCQVFQGQDVGATLAAENSAYATEAAVIQSTLAVQETQMMETVHAAETQIVTTNNINRQLVGTVIALYPPTPVVSIAIIVEDTTGEWMMQEGFVPVTSSGDVQFSTVTVTGRKRNADGCADGTQTQFSTAAREIYVIARAVDLPAGTRLSVDWLYEGSIVQQDSWTSQTSQQNFCVWFFITPADVAFSPGSWTARLYANNRAIEPPVSFTISAN